MAAVRGSDVLEASQVRIYSAAGEVIGAGFLVATDVVCTCAHVVTRALGVPHAAEQASGKPVDIDFPLLDGRPPARAAVVSWRRGGADVALLRLDATVEGARPVPLVDGTGVWGHTFRALGYPAGADRGVWASGTLRAGQGSGWVQMEAQEPGPRISKGFSGAPVWDDAQDGVIGMTVAAHQGARTAYLLPSADLVDERTLRPRCPFQGLAAFTEEDEEFFHGRDSDTARVHTGVRRRPVTLVAGPSGCGKSSLLRAGVLPRLRAEDMSVSELRPVPGVRATAVLARALIGVLEPGLGEVERLAKSEELAGLLETGDDVPAELRGRVLARGQGAGHVLFVDQLEEYAGAEPDAGRELFGLLAALAGKDGAAVLRVVATARPDSLDVLVTAATSDLVSDAVQFLAPLAADDLERAVTAPVDAVPGLWFEPGLPERIVADAGDEPGRMPLVQFALTQLWERRTRSMLTHAAYDDLGGIAGVLVTYADDALAALPQAQQDCARRLFVQLARPGEGNSFSRRPTRAADLAPELLGLARELAPGKLVVLSHAPGGGEREEIVDLAHEALTALWPRLNQWLVDSRDFRSWQEQMRADLHRWQAQHREPARLLSGTDLAEADTRLAEHPDDMSADERGYIQLSRRHSRRAARFRQTAVGALAVLTVLAVVLALTTWQSLQRTEEQLRTQAAGLLAQTVEDHPGSDPATALQLALAGWNTKNTAQTRQALLDQYARGQYLVGSYPSVWRGRVTGMDATPDGRTLIVRSRPDGDREALTVVTGVLQGEPRARELGGVPGGELGTAVSPDGRYFAATGGGGVRLWRLGGPKNPVVLGLGHQAAEKAGGILDFSSDGKRLLLMMRDDSAECLKDIGQCARGFVEAWRVPSGTQIDVSDRLVPKARVTEAAFTADADTVVTIHWTVKQGYRFEARDLASGRVRYAFADQLGSDSPELWAGGELLHRSDGATPYFQALGRTLGRKTKQPAPGARDATSRFAVDRGADSYDAGLQKGAGYAEPTLTDSRTGRSYRTRIPTSGDAPAAYKGVAAAPRAEGGLTVLVPVGTALMAVRAEPTGMERFAAEHEDTYALSPDGRFVALATGRRLEVLDASRTRHRSVSLPPPPADVLWTPTWTADSKRIVVWGHNGSLHRAYSVQDLRDSVPLDNAAPTAKSVGSVAALQGSEIALVTEDGKLARVDAAGGAARTKPFRVDPGPSLSGNADHLLRGPLTARPGHPGQVAVATIAGGQRGEILLWDTRSPRRIARLRGPAISMPWGRFDSVSSPLAFDADGSHLAVQNSDGQVRVWDVDRPKQSARSVPSSTGAQLVGFGPGNSIVTYHSEKKLIKIHALTGDDAPATLAVAAGDTVAGDVVAAFVRDQRLTLDTGDLRQSFDLRPDAQFRALCAAAGRDYTKAERKLLPDGTPSKPPCT